MVTWTRRREEDTHSWEAWRARGDTGERRESPGEVGAGGEGEEEGKERSCELDVGWGGFGALSRPVSFPLPLAGFLSF